MEAELKKVESEINDFEKQYQQVVDEISQKQVDLEFAKSLGKFDKIPSIKIEQDNLDVKSLELAIQLENARIKAEQLKKTLGEAKLNPQNSIEVQQLNSELDLMNSKLSQSKNEANSLKEEINQSFERRSILKFGNGINEVGEKIDKFKSRITRLIGTAMIFNLLRNGLTSLRNEFITLLKTDDNFSSSLNQVKANLMTAFAPIYNACLPAINSLMNALSKVTGTIAKFIAGLFGASIEDAKEQAQGLSAALEDTSKSGDKASGSLASFDNLEVVSDTSSSGNIGSNTSGSGIDYSGEIQYSQRLLDFLNAIKNFVINNKELILGLLTGIAAGLVLVKLGIDGIMALGIGLIIAGIVTLVQGIVDFIKDPSWENFATILTGLALILAGVAVAMLAVNAANPIAWIVLAISVITALAALIIKNWDTICEILGKAGEWFYNTVIKPIANFFTNMWNGLINGAKDAWNGIKSIFGSVASFFGKIFGDAWNGVKNIFSTGGKIFDGIKDGIVNSFKAIVNAIIRGINRVVSIPFNGINSALRTVRDISFMGISPFKGIIRTINVPQIPQLAQGDVIPPRHKFLAVLGDQKHGTNIEAPLETIKQANREVMQEFIGLLSNLNNNEKEIVFRNLTIVAQFGNKDFTKLVVEAVRLAEKEMGKQLFVSS